MTNEKAEPIEQRLDNFVRDLTAANQMNTRDAAMLATIRDMICMLPATIKERDVARQQRDALGGQLSDRIARFHALRVAFGETQLQQAVQFTAGEVGAAQQHMKSLAEQAGITE